MPLAARGAILGCAVAVFLMFFYTGNERRRAICIQIATVFIITAVYILFLIAYSTFFKLDDISDRLLAPVYVFVLLFMFIGLDIVLVKLKQFGKWPRIAIICLCALWLIYPLTRLIKYVYVYTYNGTGGYSMPRWVESELIEWMKTNPLEGNIYSNEPEAVYIFTGKDARISPSRSKNIILDFFTFKGYVSSNMPSYLIWFDDINKPYLYTPDLLNAITEMSEIKKVSDGTVYRFR